MSANQKRLVAFVFCVLVSLVLGLVSGLTAAVLGASALASVSAGGGAVVALLGIGVAALALFDFTDTRPSRARSVGR
ncbi:hypothetical protein [Streptomyces sp. Amel2xC10]|uniref:hypothetical protein n=1 Tax=Streptomyces sp. Amel2xC10 TaxID=1305826 RepID=UPI000A08BB85|nr:hypothetical protein [Streptomyces sp. Amel2xC10]SMF01587.1 hypothetical protein SAMN02745830_01080 [Streptomyces sp. Amel2xC10]